MNRRQESLKHKPSIAGNRAIRAHKRDVERKMLRDETLNRHRNLSAMSPLKENARNVKAGQKKSQEMKGEQDAKGELVSSNHGRDHWMQFNPHDQYKKCSGRFWYDSIGGKIFPSPVPHAGINGITGKLNHSSF